MKKICFITTISMTLDAFVLELSKYLHEHTDWDISFICDYDEEFMKRLPDYIHYYPVNMKRGISLSGIKSMNEMRRIFVREKFDMIQYSTPNASLYASIAGFLSGIPVRLYCQWGMVFVGFEGLKRKIFKLEEKLVCTLSTWVEPDSYSNLNFARKEKLYKKNKSSVIWNGSSCGVNLNKFDVSNKEKYRKEIREKLHIPKDAFVFGFVGRITKDKGINELFEASKNIILNNENTYLMLVGKEEVDETVNKELYEWANSDSKVIFTGFTTEVEKYLSAMDCYILPSYREGFGMSVVEAQSMGVPVIISNIPGPIDAIKEGVTGVICKKADCVSLEKCMNHMLDNKELCLAYGQNGIEHIRLKFEQVQMFKYIKEDRERLLEMKR